MRIMGDARAVLIGAALLIGLEACGSSPTVPIVTAELRTSSSAPSAQAASPAPTAAPTPSPTLSQDQIRTAAGTAYLSAAAAYNKASAALDKKYKTLNTLADGRAYYKAAAALDGKFLAAFRKIVLPADTVADGHSLLVKGEAQQAAELQASVDRTLSDMNADTSRVEAAQRARAAVSNLVRGDLGLPPVPFK